MDRDAAVYSPWLVKRSVALRYGLPTEMSEEVREGIARYRERQMDKRKREREERMGLTVNGSEVDVTEDDKPKTKKQKKEEEKRLKEEEKVKEEDEGKRKKPLKYPAEGGSKGFAPMLIRRPARRLCRGARWTRRTNTSSTTTQSGSTVRRCI